MNKCHCGQQQRSLNTLEVIGIVVIVGVVVAVVAAPYVASAGVGGGLIGAGVRLLTKGLFGDRSGR